MRNGPQRKSRQNDLDSLGLRRGSAAGRGSAVARRGRPDEPEAQPEVVEVRGESRARIERERGLVLALEQERVRIDGGRQVVVLPVFPLGIEKGELGQREESVPVEVGAGAPELAQRARRVLLEAFGEPEALERLLGGRTGLSGGHHASRERAVHFLRVGPDHADRRSTGACDEQHADQRDQAERRI